VGKRIVSSCIGEIQNALEFLISALLALFVAQDSALEPTRESNAYRRQEPFKAYEMTEISTPTALPLCASDRVLRIVFPSCVEDVPELFGAF
jgi:hypothetical protein